MPCDGWMVCLDTREALRFFLVTNFLAGGGAGGGVLLLLLSLLAGTTRHDTHHPFRFESFPLFECLRSSFSPRVALIPPSIDLCMGEATTCLYLSALKRLRTLTCGHEGRKDFVSVI